MPTPPSSDETIFAAALERSPAERAAFLDLACAGDPDRRAWIESLLRAHAGAGEFLESPPDALATAAAVTTPVFPPGEKPGDIIGRYKLLQKIGEGGCGSVYMAEQQEPVVRRVALKVIKLGMDTKEVVARFEAERQALALMDHAHIAKVFDAGATDAGRPYFVMELVRGIPITKFCDEQNLPTAQRLELFTQVCHAVQHAHQKGIIHRDLKPSNILVTLHDGRPMPKVIDFGIAKATQGRLTDATLFTAFEQFIGTPAYMSPEQAELSGLDIDTRSDIYSLGVLLYELLTGRTPFDPKTLLSAGLDEIRRIIREVDPPKPSTCLGTLVGEALTTAARLRQSSAPRLINIIKGDLDWIVMRCLEKDRTRRYETADALALDLQSFVRNEPVAARQPGPWYVLRKLARRHRIAVVGGGAFLLTVAGGTGLSAWFLERADEAGRDTAETWRQRHLRAVSRVVGDAFTLPRAEDPAIAPHPTLHAALDRAARRDPDALTGKLAPDSAGLEADWRETLALGYLAFHNVAAALPQAERALKATTVLTQEGDPFLAKNHRERLRQTLVRMEGIVHRPPADAATGETQARLARLKQALADLDRNASGGRNAP